MALTCLEAFYDKLGEGFLVLLPETIMYLSELLEGELAGAVSSVLLSRISPSVCSL